jgi:hypothetical protein
MISLKRYIQNNICMKLYVNENLNIFDLYVPEKKRKSREDSGRQDVPRKFPIIISLIA